MIYDDLGGFGTNGTNGTIMGHTEWHASGLWMLASSMRRYTERKPRTTLRQGTDVGYNRVITPTPFAITCTCTV